MLGLCSINNEVDRECNNNRSFTFPRRQKKKYTVAVEGNIGSGKSTFLSHFRDSPNTHVIPEPVELWKSVQGHNTLDLMYKDAHRWSLTFQSYVQLTMLQVHTMQQNAPVKLIERSVHSARHCFVENLYRGNLMPSVDYAVLCEWYDWIHKNAKVDVDLIVYVRASPKTCSERIKKRNRREENGVPMEYLESLHELHEDWLIRKTKGDIPAHILVLDADKDLSELQEDFERHRSEILCGYI